MLSGAAARTLVTDQSARREREYVRASEGMAAPIITLLNKLDGDAFRILITAGKYDAFVYANETITLFTYTIPPRAIASIRTFLENRGYDDIRVLFNKVVVRVPPSRFIPVCVCDPPICDSDCPPPLADDDVLPDSPQSWICGRGY